MKKVLSVLLCAAMLFLSVISGSALSFATADALRALQAAAGLIELSEEEALWYDMNADGEVTTADALMILRVAAGLPVEMPSVVGVWRFSRTFDVMDGNRGYTFEESMEHLTRTDFYFKVEFCTCCEKTWKHVLLDECTCCNVIVTECRMWESRLASRTAAMQGFRYEFKEDGTGVSTYPTHDYTFTYTQVGSEIRIGEMGAPHYLRRFRINTNATQLDETTTRSWTPPLSREWVLVRD
jgi:hypothetical protein